MNFHFMARSFQKLRGQLASGVFAAHIAKRAAFRELHAMSDRELHDMGIFRCDIDRIVDEIRA